MWPGVRPGGLPGRARAPRLILNTVGFGNADESEDESDVALFDCPVGPWQVTAALWRLLSATLGYGR